MCLPAIVGWTKLGLWKSEIPFFPHLNLTQTIFVETKRGRNCFGDFEANLICQVLVTNIWQAKSWICKSWIFNIWRAKSWVFNIWQAKPWIFSIWQAKSWIFNIWQAKSWISKSWIFNIWQAKLWIKGWWMVLQL